MQNLRCKKVTYSCISGLHAVVTGGRTGLIPEWVSDKSMGCEITIELPKKWYKDDNFLGFALFFHLDHFPPPYCEFSISQGDQFISVNVDFDFRYSDFEFDFWDFKPFKNFKFDFWDFNPFKNFDALMVFFFPQIVIPNEYRSRRWQYFKACIKNNSGVKSFGMHPL